MRTSNFRRRMQARAVRKARALYPDDECPAKYAGLSTPCSCWMCGNPRRHLGERSMQERRAMTPDPQAEGA